MSSGCATLPTGATTGASGASTTPIVGGRATAEMPRFDLSSFGMYPTVIGEAVLITIGVLVVVFSGAYLFKFGEGLFKWWSIFIWSSLAVLLVVLAMINGSYTGMLVNMNMCPNAQYSFIKIAMSLLSVITAILWYIMYIDFGTNQNTKTYLLIMLHVNLFLSLLNLCFVTMQKLSGLKI